VNPVLEINNLTKFYGPIQALNNVSFSVPNGSVFGILGPNGSGKTTLLGIIMNVLHASSGSFTFLGKPSNADTRKQIGTLLETPNFYHYLSGKKNLEIAASIKQKGKEDIDAILKRVNLHERQHSKFSSYSLGMKQRLAIASCLLGNPNVLVFDEPTNGLDPVGIAEIRDLIKNLAKEGKTIIMASHLLDEVEKVCTHMVILKKGNIVTQGAVDEVLSNEDIVEISGNSLDLIKQQLNNLEGLNRFTENEKTIQLFFNKGEASLEYINKYFFSQNIVLTHLSIKKKSLETKFFELTN
jgi:ABC-type multidrug transport system ATPase subunit